MADEVFGFGREEVKRILNAVAFVEKFMRRQEQRRTRMPATVHGIDYITGTLTGALAKDGTATITLDTALDDGTTTATVFGRWFSAESGDKIGATFNPYTDQYDADRKGCPIEADEGDDADGGNADDDGSEEEDGGTPDDEGGDLDGGTP